MAKQLGYACINMQLRKKGINAKRSMIRRTFDAKGLDYVSELCLANARDLVEIIKWNIQKANWQRRCGMVDSGHTTGRLLERKRSSNLSSNTGRQNRLEWRC